MYLAEEELASIRELLWPRISHPSSCLGPIAPLGGKIHSHFPAETQDSGTRVSHTETAGVAEAQNMAEPPRLRP